MSVWSSRCNSGSPRVGTAGGSALSNHLALEPLDTTEWRELVAFHESGHAVMCYVLRRPVAVVSIHQTTHWDGICLHQPERVKLEGALSGPLVLLPWELRSAVERLILVILAGPLAEELFQRRTPGYSSESTDELAARDVARQATLSPLEAEYLAASERSELQDSDDEQSTRLCRGLAVNDVEATALLNWLHMAARGIVFSPRFSTLVHALVPVLLAHDTVGGRRVRAVLRAADVREVSR